MRLGITSFVVLSLSVGLPLYASAGNLGELTPGMSEREVMQVMGRPDAIRLERNGVVCLTYGPREHAVLARIFGQRAGVIAFKENRLVNYETVHTAALCFHCSDMAAKWDPPMRPPLVCDDRWGPRCRP